MDHSDPDAEKSRTSLYKVWDTWECATANSGFVVDSPHKYIAVMGGATINGLLRHGRKFSIFIWRVWWCFPITSNKKLTAHVTTITNLSPMILK